MSDEGELLKFLFELRLGVFIIQHS